MSIYNNKIYITQNIYVLLISNSSDLSKTLLASLTFPLLHRFVRQREKKWMLEQPITGQSSISFLFSFCSTRRWKCLAREQRTDLS